MFTRPPDTNKATIFSVLVLLMALVVAVLIRFLDLTPIINLFTQVVILMFTFSLAEEIGMRGYLGKINAEESRRKGGSYVNDAYGSSEVTLDVDVQGGVGEINLKLV